MSKQSALAVGVSRYPNFPANKQLRFAKRDAERFAQWAKERGSIITTLVSPDEGPGVTAEPDQMAVDKALVGLQKQLMAELDDVLPPMADQLKNDARLYVFFSGHGVAPDGNEVAMLLADAEPAILSNIGAQAYLAFLRRLALWRQVWVFADCCRELNPGVAASSPRINVPPPDGTQVLSAEFFAVPHGDLAFEPTDPDRIAQHGIFSRCLIEGLWGAAAHPVTGRITAASLQTWLTRRLQHASNKRQKLQSTVQDPLLALSEGASTLGHGDPNSQDLFDRYVEAMLERLGTPRTDLPADVTLRGAVEAARQACLDSFSANAGAFLPDGDSVAPQLAVTIRFPDAFAGDVKLQRGDLQVVAAHTVPAAPVGRSWALPLPEGLYLIEPFLPFQIRQGAVDVFLQEP